MKIFISVDIEGITGVANWEETFSNEKLHDYFRSQMTKEVNAACEGINEVFEAEILIKDAHGSGRNIITRELPKNIKIHRDWSKGPMLMMEGLDKSFDAVMFIGYHSGAFIDGNPLAHTYSSRRFQYLKLNGEYVSEFDLNALIAGYYNVPVVFLSGDNALCEKAKNDYKNMVTLGVMEGIGNSTLSIHPDLAIEKIKEATIEAMKLDFNKCKVNIPKNLEFEIQFKEASDAYKASFYPNIIQIDPKTIKFMTKDYYEFMKMFIFI